MNSCTVGNKKKKIRLQHVSCVLPKSGKKDHMIKIMSPAHVGWYTGSFLRCCLFHITRIGISTKTGSALFCRRHLHNGRRLHITSVLVQRWIYYQDGRRGLYASCLPLTVKLFEESIQCESKCVVLQENKKPKIKPFCHKTSIFSLKNASFSQVLFIISIQTKEKQTSMHVKVITSNKT